MRQLAIIFGGLGTLVETSNIQRLAFNDALESLGIDFQWDIESYTKSLAGTGGQNRLARLVLKNSTKLSPSQVEHIHALKTNYFVSRLASTQLDLRPGACDLIDHARRQNFKLAWATTTSQANIDAVIGSTNGALNHNMFAYLGNDARVTRQKPDPQIYTACLSALGVSAGQVVAVEDGLMGVASAKAANIRTIAFPGEFQTSQDFSHADMIVTNLATLIEVPTF